MGDQLKRALCCTCGKLRTCRRPRNHRPENYFLRGPIDRDWHRETGDLKCGECGRITTHAIIHPETDTLRDHAERITNIALQVEKGNVTDGLQDRIRDAYHAKTNYPRNPYVQHKWWKADEDNARAAGQTYFPAMCGAPVKVPEERFPGADITEQIPPTQCTEPAERVDPSFLDKTGVWWASGAGWCVNCLRVRHEWLIANRRSELQHLFIRMAGSTDELSAEQVEKIWAVLQEVAHSEPT